MKTKKSRKEIFEEILQSKHSLEDSIRLLRKSVNQTQTQLAELLKIAPRSLMDLERGKGNPTLKTLNTIAAAFGFEIGLIKRKQR